MYYDMAILILRVVVGLLLAGHGAQKLFGWFGGPGLAGITGWLASTGMRPAGFWAFMAGLTEFGGGLLLALGLLNPLGSLGIIAAMLMAIIKGHWGKGLWAHEGGIELPLTYLVIAFIVGLAGPGLYSLDAALGLVLPQFTLWGGLVAVLVGIAVALLGQAPQTASNHA